ncbi:MAG: hypothetical protein ACLRP3_23165, partial [Escherichia sp.]
MTVWKSDAQPPLKACATR